jgi:poly(A) polymerase/tRNA nucleotidyltransferase (CCA-adding enzyme)
MIPFRSDHPLYHIPVHIIDWLKEQPFNVLIYYISGQSMKYLRSNQPVLVFSVPDEHYFKLYPFFSRLNHSNIKFYNYKNSFKVIYNNFIENQSLHLIVQRTFVYPHILISIDRLIYDYKNKEWKGTKEDLMDYKKGLIRLIKPENLHIKQIFNIIVYCSQLDFTIENSTLNKMKALISKEELINLDKSFIRNQLSKIVQSARPSNAFFMMDKLEILEILIPELAQTKNILPNDSSKHDLFTHCIYSCDSIKENKLHLRLAGLFYHIGKAHKTKIQQNGKTINLNHDVISAKISYKILKRFEFPKEIINKVYFLIRHHIFYYTMNLTDNAMKKFIKKISEEDLNDLIQLRLSDRKIEYNEKVPFPPQIRKLLLIIEKVKKKEQEIQIKDLQFNGYDLKQLGIPEGPIYRKTLKYLLEKVKNEHFPNTKEELKKEALHFLEKEGYK